MSEIHGIIESKIAKKISLQETHCRNCGRNVNHATRMYHEMVKNIRATKRGIKEAQRAGNPRVASILHRELIARKGLVQYEQNNMWYARKTYFNQCKKLQDLQQEMDAIQKADSISLSRYVAVAAK